MIHGFPEFPFDGIDHEDPDYVNMMEFIMRVESIQAKFLGDWLVKTLPTMTSVIDLGCGPGLYLQPFKKAGMQVLGVDGCSVAGSELAPGEFVRKDLRFSFGPWDVQRDPADLVICMEVAEHLPEQFAKTLVQTIIHCGRMVLFTAATPGQGGTFHHNEQWHDYWLKLFWDLGYGIHPLNATMHEQLETLREYESRGEVSGWLLNNAYLLAEHEMIAAWERP